MIIKIKYMLLIALAALVGCSSDDFVGDQTLRESNENAAISFGFDVPQVTRASGATAATALGNQFIVWGEKGEASSGAAYNADDGGANTHQLVFKNYVVEYSGNTAYTTTSNTKDWEYVGITPYAANVTPLTSETMQTIKYWDYGAASYTFTAVSAKKEDIEDGRVVIEKNITGAENAYQKGYTITLAKSGSGSYTYPTLNKLYFSDRKVIARSAGADRNATNVYGGNVTLTFRNLLSQVRAGIYETIPGYDVKEIKFYVSDGDDAGIDPDETTAHAFGAICPNTKADDYVGTVTVVYYTDSDGSLENQPKVTASGTPASDLILGNNYNNLSTSALLAKTSAEPTWDKSAGAYTEVLPQIENSTNLKLTVDYTLWNSVTEETIEVKGATAEIPSQYLQWKPNFKYTYLFKISDNTNGFTNPSLGPAGLWPITFDAVEIAAEDGKVEYITTVSEPSITTYAKASSVITDNEYLTGNNIYVVVEDGSTNPTLNVDANAKLYTATVEADAAQGITEATVANALVNGVAGYDGGTVLTKGTLLDGYYTKAAEVYTACTASTYADGTTTYYRFADKVVTDALGKKLAVFDVSSGLTAVNAIAADDSYTGVAISVNGAKFSPAAPTFTEQTVTVGTTVVTGWYTRTGEGTTESPYVYTLITAADTKAASETDYYAKKTSAAGYYVFEYEKPAVQATGTYVTGKKYYTTATCDVEVDTSAFVAGTTDVSSYYLAPTKHYKVIKVVDKY
ncbi:MAG: hypothetical protein IJ898_01470 [Prevotella sp.]|nr:hypothetical protein [Prevotella sp.]